MNCLSCVFTHCCVPLSLSHSQHTRKKKKNGKEKKKLIAILRSRLAKTGKSNILYRKTILTNRKKKFFGEIEIREN